MFPKSYYFLAHVFKEATLSTGFSGFMDKQQSQIREEMEAEQLPEHLIPQAFADHTVKNSKVIPALPPGIV